MTGTRGPATKHGGRRQRGRTSTQAKLAAGTDLEPAPTSTTPSLAQLLPAAEPGWLAATVESWHQYLAAPEARATTITDLPALRRLFGYRDAWLRTSQQLAELPPEDDMTWETVDDDNVLEGYVRKRGVITTGSTGQPVLHPLTKLLGSLEAQMRPLEDRFGLNPLYRLRLGITVLEAEESLEARNRRLADEHARRAAAKKAPSTRKRTTTKDGRG